MEMGKRGGWGKHTARGGQRVAKRDNTDWNSTEDKKNSNNNNKKKNCGSEKGRDQKVHGKARRETKESLSGPWETLSYPGLQRHCYYRSQGEDEGPCSGLPQSFRPQRPREHGKFFILLMGVISLTSFRGCPWELVWSLTFSYYLFLFRLSSIGR